MFGFFSVDKLADKLSTHTGWKSTAEYMGGHTFGRQAIGMIWDWCEANPCLGVSGSWLAEKDWIVGMLEHGVSVLKQPGHVEQASATHSPLPDDSASALITDPPYYDSVPYAYLSDFFYVWLRRTLADVFPKLLGDNSVPKEEEIVVDRPHRLSQSTKGIEFYERELTNAFADCRRVVRPDGIGCVVFASKSTASWEAILKAVIDAGWIVTGSWPIDTEMETRMNAMGTATLASSVHIVVRPRENPDGSVRSDTTGDWRDVLEELPRRIHEWMPRLAEEGVVGADAIFACLGPALEVFSRYSRVEKANGEAVSLKEYLVEVWAAVANEALSLIFEDADASGLEPDARLTAMWLWTLRDSTNGSAVAGEGVDEDTEDEDDAAPSPKTGKSGGFSLEFDAARKIAQGLGANLEALDTVVEVKGQTARLLPVAERGRYLTGKEVASTPTMPKGRKQKGGPMLPGLEHVEFAPKSPTSQSNEELLSPTLGATVLDRVHQAMLLFGRGAVRGDGSFSQGRRGRCGRSVLATGSIAFRPISRRHRRKTLGRRCARPQKGTGLLMGRSTELADHWRETFFDSLRDPALGKPLSTAALNENLQDWTTHLTTAVVRSCETLRWRAAAKGYPGSVLPVSRKEYLSLDVMAFEPSTIKWPLPVAVFELENKQRGEWVGYSLWKVLCVRASFRVVFAYRRDASEGPSLVAGLADEVIASLTTEQRLAIKGETLLMVGNRGEAETFPYGYFRGWRLENNTGKFERV